MRCESIWHAVVPGFLSSAAEPQKWIDLLIGLLRVAVEKGYSDPIQLELEFDFDCVRDTSEFNVILSHAGTRGKISTLTRPIRD